MLLVTTSGSPDDARLAVHGVSTAVRPPPSTSSATPSSSERPRGRPVDRFAMW